MTSLRHVPLAYLSLFTLVIAIASLDCRRVEASLIGDTVDIQSDTGFTGDPTDTSVVVGDGVELTDWGGGTNGLFNIDLDSESIRTVMAQEFSIGFEDFQGLRFSDLDWLPIPGSIVGVSAESSLGPLDPRRIDFGPDFVNIDLQIASTGADYVDNLGTYDIGDTVLLTLDVQHDQTVIPEPTTFVVWCLLGLVVTGACWWRRRATKANMGS